jgi:hypothetical protein
VQQQQPWPAHLQMYLQITGLMILLQNWPLLVELKDIQMALMAVLE